MKDLVDRPHTAIRGRTGCYEDIGQPSASGIRLFRDHVPARKSHPMNTNAPWPEKSRSVLAELVH